MTRRLAVTLLLLVALTLQASAHSYLVRSEPGQGGIVFWSEGGEGVVRLWFTERIEPTFSTVEVRDASGARVDVAGSLRAEGSGLEASIVVRPRTTGTHTVNYRMLSAVDGHTSGGQFSFVVAQATPGAGSRLTVPPGELRFAVPKEVQASQVSVALYKEGERLLQESVELQEEAGSASGRIALPSLEEGAYEVRWEMATAQGRKFGQYSFAVIGR